MEQKQKEILITGGAGFIGVNAAKRFADQGHKVLVLDNLSRAGSKKNLEWLQDQTLSGMSFVEGDVRDAELMHKVFNEHSFDRVYHFAAQVAVTSSLEDPVYDHEVNVKGTLNVLEALRKGKNPRAFFLFTSTNKVYGDLEHLSISENDTRYAITSASKGINEEQNLDLHSPYGCSKGAADQYVRDYSRIYDLNTVVFRQSCIYGPRQMGIEDQGWVAWFIRRALINIPINVYGTGKQVRDLLHINDLLNAFELAEKNISKTRGQIYNIGGGPHFAKSVVEVLQWIQKVFPTLHWGYKDWRPGDQKVYISDISKAEQDFGWKPQIHPDTGLVDLINWAQENKKLLSNIS